MPVGGRHHRWSPLVVVALNNSIAATEARDAGASAADLATGHRGSDSGTGADQPSLVGEDHGLDAVAKPELAKNSPDVGFDRRLGQVQPLGDLGVG